MSRMRATRARCSAGGIRRTLSGNATFSPTVYMGPDRIGLKHDAERTRFRRQIDPALAVEDGLSADRDAALVWRLQAGEAAQDRGLAASAGAEQRQRVALGDLERDAFDRNEAAEALAEALDGDERIRSHGLPAA